MVEKTDERGGKRFRYANPSTDLVIEVDTIIDGDEITLIPQDSCGVLRDQVRRLPFAPNLSLDELIRVGLSPFLDGFTLVEVEGDTAEVEFSVLREMDKTPISLKDGCYGKEFLDALILCLDLRQFSSYARDGERGRVQGFLERYTQELLAGINGYPVSYYKLLGDGALALWDHPTRSDLDSAIELFTILRSILGEIGSEFGYPHNLAGALVLDEVYKYEIYAESSGLKYRDYVGYGLNYAFRLQTMAKAGVLLASRNVERDFDLGLPLLDAASKPRRDSLKGVRDEDYDEVYVLVPAED